MIKIFFVLFFSSFLFGAPFDYYYIFKANSLEKDGKLNEALYNYNQIKNKSDEVQYNIGNLYYKEKNYKKAIEVYKKIKLLEKELSFKTLHNLGNSYAKMGELSDAIKSYENALKIKEDKDTRYNLELLKKKQNDQKQKEEQNRSEDKQNDKNSKSDNQEQQNKDKVKNESSDQNQESKDDQGNKIEQSLKQEKKQNQARKAAELSDLEEKKWSQMLDNRDIKTLVVPISNNGEKNEQNIKPW